ncbi:MAG: nucleotidyltransferase [Candidatus Melainabacteria bacterium]|nr:nucleotidyltransferase [Candidatus Melainabacteria bacterium]
MFFEKIFKALNENNVKYLVIGGAAVNLHGYVRVTHDLDLFIALDESNIKKFSTTMKALKFKPKVPGEIEELGDNKKRENWIKEKNMKVFSLYNEEADEIIDIMVLDYLKFDESYKERKIIKVKELEIPLASIKDLIKLKEIAGRGKDIIDLKVLLEIQERLNNEK